MRLLGSHVWRGRVSSLLGALTIGAVAASSLDAQRVERVSNTILNPDGSPARSISARRGFNLFGSADIAVTGMKQVGQMGYALTNYGPGAADGYSYTGDFNNILKGGVWYSKYFESPFILGASRSEFRKIRTVYPAIGANVIGGGYTYQWNQPLLSFRGEIAPSDNSLGSIFSGVQSTTDGSCRDISSAINGFVAAGASLLPMSDCPETWGPAGWQGPRIIPDSAFRILKNQLGADFNWQYWRVDPDMLGGNLGNFSTFGLMTDYTTELLDSYGAVTPRGSGTPAIDGYPLGIDMKFEAFSSSLPSLANAVIWQVTLVNNSANVYGTGIDYDSLYAGLELGFYDALQQANTYYETDRGSVLSANRGVHTACNGTRTIAETPGCASIRGFDRGAVGVTFLKSPIGDMRNKLFTRDGPFNDPSHPRRGDTITFNHGHKCGYGACFSGNLDASVRRQFGLISSTPENVLDGRSVNEMDGVAYYYTFRQKEAPERNGTFNWHIPNPSWDYDHDGDIDTVYFDTCHESLNNTVNAARGKSSKCVSTWSDSMPGGFVNAYGNVGGAATAGPFKLAAGDTTSFIIAFTAGLDSIGIETITNNVIEGYLNFWAGPTGPPNPTVVTTNVSGTADEPIVRITYSNAPEVWVDPFLTKYANDLESSGDPNQIRLRTLNPGLVDAIRARAASGKNFKTLYVFKSCDGGNTFTSDTDCIGDPAIGLGGTQIGNGWQPYEVIQANASGEVTNLFEDEEVVAGRTYLYSFVAQSRGFQTTVLDSVNGELVAKQLIVADSILNPVNTSGPNVANVYVPISLAAGTSAANFTLTRMGDSTTTPVEVGLSSAAQSGTYTGVFGNRFIVIDSIEIATGATTTYVIVQEYFADAVTAAGTPIAGGQVAAADTFSGPGPIGIGGFTPSFTTTNAGAYQVRIDTLVGNAFLLTKGDDPLYISNAPSENETTPSSFLGSPLFPGFVLSIDTSLAGDYAGEERAIKPPADTLPAGVFNVYGVQWNQSKSDAQNGAAGQYEFTFSDDSYGPNAPFQLDVTNPTALQTAVTQSLAARDNAMTADTTAATLALVREALDDDDATLVPARLPFTVRNTTFNRDVTVAMLARRRPVANNTVLLGDGIDTLRVEVDSLVWLPGDTLIFLESVTVDSTDADDAVVIDPGTGAPFQVQRTLVTFAPAVLECSSPRPSCNPIRIGSPGASGYLTYVPDTKVYVTYEAGFGPGSQFAVTITGAAPSGVFGAHERSRIRVVPNPYIVQSEYDVVTNRIGTSRVYFTNVPANGQLRIYSVSGQFLQQLDWTAADLNNTGDLPYDLRTREGTDLTSGLYIWTIKATQATGKSELARGKFVVIR